MKNTDIETLTKKMNDLGYTYVFKEGISDEGFLAWERTAADGSKDVFVIDGWEAVSDLVEQADKLCERYTLPELKNRVTENNRIINDEDYTECELNGAIYKLEHSVTLNQKNVQEAVSAKIPAREYSVDASLEDLKSSLQKIQEAATAAIAGIDKELAYIKDSRIQDKLEKNALEDHSFSGRLHRFLSQSQAAADTLFISPTPYALIVSGARASLDIVIKSNTITKCMADVADHYHGHNLTEAIIRQLPQELRNPVMIFKGSRDNSLALISSLEDSRDHRIVIAVHLNEHGTHQEVNRIASMYGKDNIHNYLRNQLEQGNLIAANVPRASNMLRATDPSLRLPPAETYIQYDDRIATSMECVQYPHMALQEAAATMDTPEQLSEQDTAALGNFKKQIADNNFQCTDSLVRHYTNLLSQGITMTLNDLCEAYNVGTNNPDINTIGDELKGQELMQILNHEAVIEP